MKYIVEYLLPTKREWLIKEHEFNSASDQSIKDIKTVHVIEYSAYESAIKERDEARAEINALDKKILRYADDLDEARAECEQYKAAARPYVHDQLTAERQKSAKLVSALELLSSSKLYDLDSLDSATAMNIAAKALAEHSAAKSE